ncbi:MAG: energy-coupling factor ABC transporter ATP-binding protein [Proteobacteria bacterium]|nr:energy-coupling factor ABC transporter ATP-binding protein [Pseudomonadota bacterium]
MSAPLYRLRGVEAGYGEAAGLGPLAASVLHVPELSIAHGSIVGLAGHNGSGKSTLLKLLGFLLSPSMGDVYFDGRLVDQAALRAGHLLRRRAVLLGQDTCLLKRSVAANVFYGLKVRGLGADRRAVDWALELVGLDPVLFARRAWYELSGGEAQRVALAARLVLRPKVLLLDEPTASLDEESALRIREASLAAREQWGATLVAVSHDMIWLRSLSDEIVFMRGGRLTEAPSGIHGWSAVSVSA